MRDLYRHIIGYTIGMLIFILLIPFGLFTLSVNDPILQPNITNHILIRVIISLPLLVLGLIFAIWSNVWLLKTGKGGPTDVFNIAISPRTKKLVIIGPYQYCRNPMVFGAFCVYFSVGLFMLSITSLILLIFFLLLIAVYLRSTEEKRLTQDFGDDYIRYKSKVPMIIPKKLK